MEIQITWIQKFNHKDAKDNSFGGMSQAKKKYPTIKKILMTQTACFYM